ncbi:Rad4-domain-containing protein [Corynespora cassiicola Philippines]|uniref:Rad4-domain-containing protein n=1 Tax=Corynespora cassiicola Philippines TaxID=1448308 RepID=A0A2T2P7R8_CORCC|nr:Rad4-domain-containing protein [Corynespora cassiicola Philippines]
MAGRRNRLHKSEDKDIPRRSTRRGKLSQENAGVPDVFQDMLVDEQTSSADIQQAKPLKRRAVQSGIKRSPDPDTQSVLSKRPKIESPPVHAPALLQAGPNATSRSQNQARKPRVNEAAVDGLESPPQNGRMIQTVEDSEESDDSDLEWEDALGDDGHEDEDDEPVVGDISITIGDNQIEEAVPKKQIRRRAITTVEKKRRLDIHKMHILCLLYHVHRRNAWCNDGKVHAMLRKIPPPKALDNLVPNPEFSQFQASKRFLDGMNELKLLWSKRFKVTAQGMSKPKWADADANVRPFSDFDELDDVLDREDFRKAASKLQGSQDIGAQLFCSMLRSIGVETRLVCSLQCLPFASAAQPDTPQKATDQKKTITIDPFNKREVAQPKPKTPAKSRPIKRWSRLEQAMGEQIPKAAIAPKQKKYHTPYPVYWVEALNPAHQKWIPIDPHATYTVNAPDKLEPPLNSTQNSLVYAVAFEDDYTARDVTRRYAKAYNAKTRKFRVECTPDGEKWWKRALKMFKRSGKLDRDQVEDASLGRKAAAEGIPKNVQDFKDHPIYVLERHLKHNEVIYPMNQVGKVNVGSSMNPKMEPIYRRKDVHIVRSADKWYRLGRDVKDGEQPLKHAKPKKRGRLSLPPPDMGVDDQQEEVGAGLYAFFQTELYVPPPVVRGRVPRNAYGNLDLYVPSMCPRGGVHIRHKQASKAARIVGVDYADAVTGFSFKGRHGTAVVQGVVVAEEYAAAVEAVLEAMEYAQEEAETAAKRSESLRLWRRFFLGLRIAQRVNAIEIDGETGPVLDVQEEIEREDKELAEKEFAGGFFPDESSFGESAEPTTRYEPTPTHDEFAGGFVPNGEDEEGGFIPDHGDGGFLPERQDSFGSAILAAQQLRPRHSVDLGGGFISEEEEEAGGFMRESSLEAGPSSRQEDLQGGFMPEDKKALSQHTKSSPRHIGEAPSEPKEVDNDVKEVSTEPTPPSSSPSDTGSLPLEDPEDEDADPDWLVELT